MATKVTQDDLLEAIDGMTVLELSDFIKKFEERYGVTAAAPVATLAGLLAANIRNLGYALTQVREQKAQAEGA